MTLDNTGSVVIAAITTCSSKKSQLVRMISLGEYFAIVLIKKALKLLGEMLVVKITLPLILKKRSIITCAAVVEAVYSIAIINYA